jgi:hypothetical protein
LKKNLKMLAHHASMQNGLQIVNPCPPIPGQVHEVKPILNAKGFFSKWFMSRVLGQIKTEGLYKYKVQKLIKTNI